MEVGSLKKKKVITKLSWGRIQGTLTMVNLIFVMFEIMKKD